jgi:hypothetical protein
MRDVDGIQLVLLAAKGWRRAAVMTAIACATVYWIGVVPPPPLRPYVPDQTALLLRDQRERAQREIADLSRIIRTLKPSQAVYWNAREGIRNAETDLFRLRNVEPPSPPKRETGPLARYGAAILGAVTAALGSVYIERWWRGGLRDWPLAERWEALR